MNRIHPLSLLLGLALAAVCFLTMSQVPVLATSAVRIEYMPHPRDMVQIQEGIPFVVPQNRIFVLTGLGGPQTGTTAVYINGVLTMEAYCSTPSGPLAASSIQSVPLGMSAPAGSIVTVLAAGLGHLPGVALGYLSGL